MEIGVKVYEDNKEKSQEYESEILDRYKESGIISVLLEQGLNYLIGGAGCLYYPSKKINQAEICSLDPRYVYLGWQGGKLVQFAFKEFFGTEYKIHYWDLSNHFIVGVDKKIEEREKNESGFIPFSWVPNFPRPHRHEGRSKVLAIFDLDREYNFRASDNSKRVADNTEAMLVVASDNIKEGSVKRGKKKVLYLGKDDDAKYITIPEGETVITWLDKIEAKIRRKTGLKGDENFGSRASGVSLSYQYSDMLDLIGFMRVFWDQAFRDLNKAILSYKFGFDNEYKTDPVYQPILMQDTKARIEEVAIMIEKGLISRKDAIDELRGVENAEQKLAEILEEREKFNSEPIDDLKNKNKND